MPEWLLQQQVLPRLHGRHDGQQEDPEPGGQLCKHDQLSNFQIENYLRQSIQLNPGITTLPTVLVKMKSSNENIISNQVKIFIISELFYI